MNKKSVFIISSFYFLLSCSQILANSINDNKDYPKSLVNYQDFKSLVSEVENHRKKNLVNLDTFLKMSKEKNVIILDARSNFRYERKHLKGAINLSFTDFTQNNLLKIIPDTNTKILIYCNNNFSGDQVDFETKMSVPNRITNQLLSEQKPIMLALNIPTYINLYGYGYKNIYELDELVDINDKRIVFEGTEIK